MSAAAAETSGCVFCAIVAGAAPARIVFRDADVVAFTDIRPIRPGHTLVVPVTHAPRLSDLSATAATQVYATARKISAAMRTGPLAADGVNLIVNDGKAAFQTVFHHHMHVVPRHRGDALKWVAGLVLRRDGNPDSSAAAVRAGVESLSY